MGAVEAVTEKSRLNVYVYKSDPSRLAEDFNIEEQVLAGSYGYRQVLELVQNGADAVLERTGSGSTGNPAWIHVGVYGNRLYVANTGEPFSVEGYRSLLSSHVSTKRANQIGRFGLGFKSVLKFGGVVDVFSRTNGDIRFDPSRCREELSTQFNVEDAPGLRKAWALSSEERTADERLIGLLDWAETVVSAELANEQTRAYIRAELSEFPVEFLLFMPPGLKLALQVEEDLRILTSTEEAGTRVLNDNEHSSKWLVRSRTVPMTDERANEDATHIHARESVPLNWAVPVSRRQEEAGRFWAFFPTDTDARIPGIINAPWKTNTDRKSVLRGEWNEFLMRVAAELFVDTLPELSTPEDPGAPLDAFPRRIEHRDAVAAPLVEAIDERLADACVVPDGLGKLRKPLELSLFPGEVSQQAALQWHALASDDLKRSYVHPSALAGQRENRLGLFLERCARRGVPSSSGVKRKAKPAISRWVNALTGESNPDERALLKLVDELSTSFSEREWAHARPRLRVVPVVNDEWSMPDHSILAPETLRFPGKRAVRETVAADEESYRILKELLRVKPLDESSWQEVLTDAIKNANHNCDSWRSDLRAQCNTDWREIWLRLREAPETIIEKLLHLYGSSIRVFTCDGTASKPENVLVPGDVITREEAQADSSSFDEVLLDESFHRADASLLERLGCLPMPDGLTSEYRSPRELEPWREARARDYKQRHGNRATESYLTARSLEMPRGWRIVPRLRGLPNARLTRRYLALIERSEIAATVRFGHSTQDKYPEDHVSHPLPWWLVRHGTLDVFGSAVPLRVLLKRFDVPAITQLSRLGEYSRAIQRCGEFLDSVRVSESDCRALWQSLIQGQSFSSGSWSRWQKSILSAAAQDGFVPDTLVIDGRERQLDELFVGISESLARNLSSIGFATLAVDSNTVDAWLEHGANAIDTVATLDWDDSDTMVLDLRDAFPELSSVLPEARGSVFETGTVDGLSARLDAQNVLPLETAIADSCLLINRELFGRLTRREQFSRILREATALGWLDVTVEEALDRVIDESVENRRNKVLARETLADKILECVGGRRDPLLDLLGTHTSAPAISEADEKILAELAVATFGPTLLSELSDTLEEEGLRPPKRWSGTKARQFVRQLGFPPEFAASTQMGREAETYVSGPFPLPPLHDYQNEVFEGLRTLFSSPEKRRRAVVSLPTGAGKTRVVVEAAVRLILSAPDTGREVMWIAQTDELCEQAVQSFRQVWSNLGSDRTDLRVIRLWGGNPNPAPETEMSRPTVVVATIQTLTSRIVSSRLEWLRNPGLVVVDECHHAITKSYTQLLRWLDAAGSNPEKRQSPEPILLGLSATPFRVDHEESCRLARRFSTQWLPPEQEDLYRKLSADKVLSAATYDFIESTAVLTDEERRQFDNLPEPWDEFALQRIIERINERLAQDEERNELLIETVQSSTAHSILLFANSVAHARDIAMRLNLLGVTAAAIGGETPRSARRYFLERFESGDIRVLCNHSVLSTGFDAPKTEMIVVSRNVVSPVRFMQMVGRGLRGPKNGGTPQCRIVTVLDNLGRFKHQHPYHYCEGYFE